MWYTAHVVMYLRFKDGHQNRHYIQENLVLVEAKSDAEARAAATEKAERDYAGDSDGTLRCDGRPASWQLVGVRKVVDTEDSDERPASGTEVSYLEYALASSEDLRRLMAGEDITVEFDAKQSSMGLAPKNR